MVEETITLSDGTVKTVKKRVIKKEAAERLLKQQKIQGSSKFMY